MYNNDYTGQYFMPWNFVTSELFPYMYVSGL